MLSVVSYFQVVQLVFSLTPLLFFPYASSAIPLSARESTIPVQLLRSDNATSDFDTARVFQQLIYGDSTKLSELGVGLWAWPLPMDWNEDGLMDLVVACTDRPSNGIYVFLNTGVVDPMTRLPVFSASERVGPAGRNPQVSYVDGTPFITTSGSFYPDFRTNGLKNPVMLGNPDSVHIAAGRVRANQWKFVDYTGNGLLDLVVGIGYWGDYGWDDAWDEQGNWTNGPLHGYVYLLENTGTNDSPVYADPTQLVTEAGDPIDVFGMPSPSFADFDGDGDLDLMCGEFLDGFTYFQNIGTRDAPTYTVGKKLQVAGKPLAMELCMITPVAVDFNADGYIDLVVGDEDGRVAFVEGTGEIVDGVPQFLPPRYFRQQADKVKFGALAAPVSVDWDGDGLEDLVVGNTAGYIGFIKNLGGDPPLWANPVYLAAGTELLREQAGANGSIQGPAEAKWGYTNPSVGDWDGDGLLDVVTNGIWGKVLFYKNIGTPTQPRLAAGQPIEVAYIGIDTPKPSWTWWVPRGNELVTQWRTTPQLIDWNKDGMLDLVMLDQEGYLALFTREKSTSGELVLGAPQRVFWAEGVSAYDGSGRPQNQTSGLLRMNVREAGGSGRRTFTFYDWDKDGTLDLLVNSDTNVNILRGLGQDSDGRWRYEDIGSVSEQRLAAHSTTPTIATWEGKSYLVVGAEDGFFYYMQTP